MFEETVCYYESVFNIQFNAALYIASGCCERNAEAFQSVSQNNTRRKDMALAKSFPDVESAFIQPCTSMGQSLLV